MLLRRISRAVSLGIVVTTFTGALNVNADSDEARSFARTPQGSLSAGATHTCIVTNKGAVLCWGNNGVGQVGTGNTRDQLFPTAVSRLTGGVKAVSAGGSHSCALTTSGAVKCWGANDQGQLGNGTTASSSVPVDVKGLDNVASVSAGAMHTCAVTTAGAVWCWGRNDFGETTGTGKSGTVSEPVQVAGLASGMRAVSTGGNFSCAVGTDGGVRCWGDNQVGYLGDGTTTKRTSVVQVAGLSSGVEAISSGGDHTCVLTTVGAAKCWGFNRFGQLGNGSKTNSASPVDVVSTVAYSAISGGALHTCAVTTSGAVQCWGMRNQGQVGLQPNTADSAQTTPRAVGTLSKGMSAVTSGQSHTCARTTNGDVKCWGDGSGTLLGLGVKARILFVPVDALRSGPTSATVTYPSRSSTTFTAVLRASGTKIPAGTKVSAKVAKASRSVCAIRGTKVAFTKAGRCSLTLSKIARNGRRSVATVTVQAI